MALLGVYACCVWNTFHPSHVPLNGVERAALVICIPPMIKANDSNMALMQAEPSIQIADLYRPAGTSCVAVSHFIGIVNLTAGINQLAMTHPGDSKLPATFTLKYAAIEYKGVLRCNSRGLGPDEPTDVCATNPRTEHSRNLPDCDQCIRY